MANCFKRQKALSLEDYTRLSTFFHKMYDFNPSTRVIDIDALLNEYENILLEIGILTRLGKSFVNNVLVNKAPAPPAIMKEAQMDEHMPPEYLSVELQEFANKDPIEINVKCPDSKEFNPITKRCVKKCKEGYERNEKFKCYSVAKKSRKIIPVNVNLVNINSPKRCPDDKELNPKTNRCVNKCPPGLSRNAKFQCRKKTQKISFKSSSISRSNNSRSNNSRNKSSNRRRSSNRSSNRRRSSNRS
jgi:hypothetical protein